MAGPIPSAPNRYRTHARHFGLRGKLVGLLLLLSLPLSGLFGELMHRYLQDRFDQMRRSVLAHYQRQINGLIRQQRKHLEQVAIALPELSNVRSRLAMDDLGEVKRHFDHFWPAFQLDMGLTDAFYFDAIGNPLAHWNDSTSATSTGVDPDVWRPILARAREREGPISFIDCSSACRIRAVAPALVQGRLTGFFAVGASLAETVLTFRETTPAEIAILNQIATKDSTPLAMGWGMRIEALSNRTMNQTIVESLAKHLPWNSLLDGPHRITRGEHIYEAAGLQLADDNQTVSMHVLVLEDISAALSDVRETANKSLNAILLTAALSMLLVYLLLGRSLKRLRRTSLALPLLGKRAFEQLRASIRPRHWTLFFDEIDLLDQTALELSYQLESLENVVEERSRSLRAALHEITQEKAFTDRLLESAEAIIATTDRNGCLLSLNRYGRELTGYDSPSDFIGRPLVGSALLPNASLDLYGRLHEILTGQIKYLRHEATMAEQPDGSGTREISWVHTRLNGQNDGEAGLLSIGLDISERKRNERHLNYLQDYDPLTDTLNRHGFQNKLEDMLDMAQRLGIQGALFYLDLDRFKYLNETAGHQAGDALLMKVAHTLKTLLNDETNLSAIGRLGGDEFALVVFDSNRERAIELAEKIIQTLSTLTMNDALNFSVAASIGIALFPEEDMTAQSLLINADIAMYQAKGEKRGGWHLFSADEKERERLQDLASWEARIKQGIAQDHFVLFFQPVIRLNDHEISHYEVLIRLKNPDGSLTPPGLFLDVAERSGLIGELDRWVARKALEKLASMTGEYAHIALAMNLSGSTLSDPRLLDDLHAILHSSAVDPGRIIFEITETAAVADIEVARKFVDTLRAWGCSIALDDFGSGFSSFYYLKQFPVDCVKIDGSFIRNLPDNEDDQIFVRAMVDIAKAYGKKTVAEFVENQSIVHWLERLGVDYAQGYHLGKPAPTLLPPGWPNAA